MKPKLDNIETAEEAEEILRDYKIECMKGLLERYMKREGNLAKKHLPALKNWFEKCSEAS
jgi:hypothetical protein